MPCVLSISLDSVRFDALAAMLARDYGADMFLSAPGYPGESRSIVGVRVARELIISEETSIREIKKFAFGSDGPCMGFLSYSYGMKLRGIVSEKKSGFPCGHLKKYQVVIQYDDQTCEMNMAGDVSLCHEVEELAKTLHSVSKRPDISGLHACAPEVSLDQRAYEQGVAEVLERIRSGWTYQLNLSTRLSWQIHDMDGIDLFMGLRRKYPAPFYGYVQSGSHEILSTSPERFLKVCDGQVLSQPIKGTARIDSSEEDARHALVNSGKESAELSMIVDLIRNDISTNCRYGSVRVEDHKSVFRVDDLLQMYTSVRGELRESRDCIDLFLDAFPGGSVTGCPKQSSMRIIEELEPHSRDVYCGSLLIIEDEQNMDSSIAIRTAVYDITTGQLEYWAGSGIVMASDPHREYCETMAKAAKFLHPESS